MPNPANDTSSICYGSNSFKQTNPEKAHQLEQTQTYQGVTCDQEAKDKLAEANLAVLQALGDATCTADMVTVTCDTDNVFDVLIKPKAKSHIDPLAEKWKNKDSYKQLLQNQFVAGTYTIVDVPKMEITEYNLPPTEKAEIVCHDQEAVCNKDWKCLCARYGLTKHQCAKEFQPEFGFDFTYSTCNSAISCLKQIEDTINEPTKTQTLTNIRTCLETNDLDESFPPLTPTVDIKPYSISPTGLQIHYSIENPITQGKLYYMLVHENNPRPALEDLVSCLDNTNGKCCGSAEQVLQYPQQGKLDCSLAPGDYHFYSATDTDSKGTLASYGNAGKEIKLRLRSDKNSGTACNKSNPRDLEADEAIPEFNLSQALATQLLEELDPEKYAGIENPYAAPEKAMAASFTDSDTNESDTNSFSDGGLFDLQDTNKDTNDANDTNDTNASQNVEEVVNSHDAEAIVNADNTNGVVNADNGDGTNGLRRALAESDDTNSVDSIDLVGAISIIAMFAIAVL